jgi:hypothetical protein
MSRGRRLRPGLGAGDPDVMAVRAVAFDIGGVLERIAPIGQ